MLAIHRLTLMLQSSNTAKSGQNQSRLAVVAPYPPPHVRLRLPGRATDPATGDPFGQPTQRWTMPDDQPVMTALAEITAVSFLHSNLPAREHMIARLAALVAVDAPTASYVMNANTAAQTGITVEDVQSLLVAVAPIVGTARVCHRCRADHRGPRVRHRARCRGARRRARRPRKQPRRRQTSAEDRRGTPVSMGALVPRSRQTVDQPDRQADPEPAAIHQVAAQSALPNSSATSGHSDFKAWVAGRVVWPGQLSRPLGEPFPPLKAPALRARRRRKASGL